jgi:glutaredoxin
VSVSRLTLLTKPGCHLCDEARDVVDTVLDSLVGAGVAIPELQEQSIYDDPDLFGRYAEEIPVVLLDGKVHTYWRVDPERLTKALRANEEGER